MEEYIDFEFSPYAFKYILNLLYKEGIRKFAITKEDYELHIRIKKSYLEYVIKEEEIAKNKKEVEAI